ncbi:MAG: four helix bundle protein [Bacteroidales bacterium]|jgi:four helix bundle protein
MVNNKNNFAEIMSERFLEFAAIIIKLETKLCKTYAGRHIYGQLFRAGSSSGANYEESIAAESKADFIHKTQVTLKEVRESNFWLRLIKKSNLINDEDSDLKFLLQESFEYIKIFSSSLVTAKSNKT